MRAKDIPTPMERINKNTVRLVGAKPSSPSPPSYRIAPGFACDSPVRGLVALEHDAVGEPTIGAEAKADAGFARLRRGDDAGFCGRELDAFAGDRDVGEFL